MGYHYSIYPLHYILSLLSHVHSLLHGAELHPDDELRLGGHVFEDVRLQPPEHVGSQHVVQLLDLVLFGDVSKLFQEPLQVTTQREEVAGK